MIAFFDLRAFLFNAIRKATTGNFYVTFRLTLCDKTADIIYNRTDIKKIAETLLQ